MKKFRVLLLTLFLVAGLTSFSAQAKYVFLFIGDGMAMPQFQATEMYLQEVEDSDGLVFTDFVGQGVNTTRSLNSFITDSAAAGTAIATGVKTNSGMISVLPDGKKLETLVEIAEKNNYATGLVSTTRITHATPAVFSSHNISRNNENEIAEEISKADVDFIAGGGYRYFVPQDGSRGKSKRKDDRDLLQEMANKGYKVFLSEEDTDDFLNYYPRKGDKVVGLFTYSHLSYDIDRINANKKEPSLAEMTAKGIETLSKNDKFFMMVEGGRIDHACHANDAMTSIQDTIAFNDSVKEAVKFYNKHPEETLIIVTADHETGGMTIGFAGTKYETHFKNLKDQKLSYEEFSGKVKDYTKSASNANLSDMMNDITNTFGLLPNGKDNDLALTDYEENKLRSALKKSVTGLSKDMSQYEYLTYGPGYYDPLTLNITHILNNKAGIGWTTYSHTGVPVATFAKGKGEDLFNGYYDNTDIFNKIKVAMFY